MNGRRFRRGGLPCVVKPVSSFQWHVGNAWQRVGTRKGFRVENLEQLKSEYQPSF